MSNEESQISHNCVSTENIYFQSKAQIENMHSKRRYENFPQTEEVPLPLHASVP